MTASRTGFDLSRSSFTAVLIANDNVDITFRIVLGDNVRARLPDAGYRTTAPPSAPNAAPARSAKLIGLPGNGGMR